MTVPKRWQINLLNWFNKNKRTLPWRNTKNPYAIWISEVMLQQTTSKAVIPYYKKFMEKFPQLKNLAQAHKSEVFPLWAGLGYYRRAENLIQAAEQIYKKNKFPQSYKELLTLPGFGPYTARAVSSLAFQESVGVIDGNVIRFFSRFYGVPWKWWQTQDKKELQNRADAWVQGQNSRLMNQALMEIGSLICTPKKPLCLMCPLVKHCKSFKKKTQNHLPLKQSKKSFQIWHWKPRKIQQGYKWAFSTNQKLPFLKGKMMFPGSIQKLKNKPKKYDFSHTITHHQIFITIQKKSTSQNRDWEWLSQKEILAKNPSSLIKKVFTYKN